MLLFAAAAKPANECQVSSSEANPIEIPLTLSLKRALFPVDVPSMQMTSTAYIPDMRDFCYNFRITFQRPVRPILEMQE
jgi:hypothetical protein